MISLEDAVERILAALPAPVTERAAVRDAAERVLAKTIVSPTDLPPFDNSSMDGYAVRAADVAGAKTDAPVRLKLCGKIPAGAVFAGEINTGQCARIFTGSPLPRGADAVVMQEDTRTDAARTEEVLICDAVQPQENVRLRGEDVDPGATLVEAGEVLSAGKLALLAAVGATDVTVGLQPVIGVLATGSELREAGESLASGQIYESNRAMLSSLITRAGGVAKIFPLVPDTLEATRAALGNAFAQCDAVITSGGVSVGEMDFVKAAFSDLGGELKFWRVAIRPGKPFVFGRQGGKFLFGLPGNPVSAFVTFLMLVRPALRRWQGAREIALPAYPGTLAEPFSNPTPRRHFVRVRVTAGREVFSAGEQGAHRLRSLAEANGLVDVPPQTTLPAGTSVVVLRWD